MQFLFHLDQTILHHCKLLHGQLLCFLVTLGLDAGDRTGLALFMWPRLVSSYDLISFLHLLFSLGATIVPQLFTLIFFHLVFDFLDDIKTGQGLLFCA